MPVEQWNLFEVSLKVQKIEGNPFTDINLSAQFKLKDRAIDVPGFYDGDGAFRIRFSPDQQGAWSYQVRSDHRELDGKTGTFVCVAPSAGNHGPVRVHNTFHFQYADETPYRQIGTTAYAWTHQGPELEELTLATLKQSPFNKMRMCIFPKNYAYNAVEPPLYPFEGTAPNKWDFTRFNPAFFQHQEKRIKQLLDLGIEADVILFHPYDEGRWGFDRMNAGSDDRYLKYVIARLGAFRHVWWSLANEFDFMKEKKPADWDRYLDIVVKHDPHKRLCSIHNGRVIYNHTKPGITHVSMQNGSALADFGRGGLYRETYYKPVVFDEVKYEGDIPERWGNLSAEEMVHRFWQGTIAGTYVGHGETYQHPEAIIWWARGGALHGKSPARIAFLKQVMESSPASGIEPIDKWQDLQTAGKAGEYYLIYFGNEKPTEFLFSLPREALQNGMEFRTEILDTWNMTVTPVAGTFKIIKDGMYRFKAEGDKKIPLPGKAYIALRITRVGDVPVAAKAGDEPRVFGEG